MIPVAIDANAELDDSMIVADIRKLFANYGPTFVQLADGERMDINSLLDFYGAPLTARGVNPDTFAQELGVIHRSHS